MLKLRHLWLALTSLCLAVSPSVATDFGDIAVTVAPDPGGNRHHGYAEYRINVTNRASQTAHHVKLTIPGISYGGAGGAAMEDVSRAVTVQPSSRVVVSLFVPGIQVSGSGVGVSIDGNRESELVPVTIIGVGDLRPAVLISPNINRKGFDKYSTGARGSSTVTSYPGTAVATTTAVALPEFAPPTVIPVSEWSESWLGYSSFDCVVATGDEIRSLLPTASSALWQYVKCGGTLLVLGTVDVPEAWRVRLKGTTQIPTYYVGYGQCLVAPRDIGLFSNEDWVYLHESCNQSQAPYDPAEIHERAEANRIFPVVDKLSVPVRGLFLLMLLFVIVIGPLNLFVLSRMKKKIWLLWTVPAISLITCVAVSAYTIMAEGWRGKARTAGLTILDETSHQATTIGWTAFYSPLTPGDGLHYGYETELTAQLGFQYVYGRAQTSARSIDWTEDQHLASGWVTARVPVHFKIRKSEMRRERITLNRGQGGSLSVVNGLGVDVRELWLADHDGKIYRANSVRAGASAVLELQQSVRAGGAVQELRIAFTESEWFSLERWPIEAPGRLMPGCYIAAADSSPFIEDGLREVGERKNEAVIYGIMKVE